MGCCASSLNQPENPNSGDGDGDGDHHEAPGTNVNPLPHPPSQPPAVETAAFRRYTFTELRAATHRFSHRYNMPKGAREVPNFVYKGSLPGGQRIAVKRFSKCAWPDASQFEEAANRTGTMRHRRIVNLIGYCCEGDERLLVAKFMRNRSLEERLFKSTRPLEWSMRMRVACYIAEALDYCANEKEALYYDLHPYKVLFDEAGNPCLSCFGLVKNYLNARCNRSIIAYTAPESINGLVTNESVIFGFGILLQVLLSGKHIPQGQVIEMMLGKDNPIIRDPRLKKNYPSGEATALMQLAVQCMRHNRRDRPIIRDVIATLLQIRSNAGASSSALPGAEGQPPNAGDS